MLVLTEKELNRILDGFANGKAELTLTMSRDGIWLRYGGVGSWPLTGKQADKILTAMRCMRIAA